MADSRLPVPSPAERVGNGMVDGALITAVGLAGFAWGWPIVPVIATGVGLGLLSFGLAELLWGDQ